MGNNLYSYCGNNPITYVDYTGNRLTVGGGGSEDSLNRSLKVTDSKNYDYIKGIETKQKPIAPPSDYKYSKSKNQNCYSYAFDLPHKANPGDFSKTTEDPSSYLDKPVHAPEEIAFLVKRDMKVMGKSVRVVNSPADKRDNEYIVAMKTSNIILGEYADYHFAVQLNDGTWADKTGTYPSRWNHIVGTSLTWDLDTPNIPGYYNTKSVYFAVAK